MPNYLIKKHIVYTPIISIQLYTPTVLSRGLNFLVFFHEFIAVYFSIFTVQNSILLLDKFLSKFVIVYSPTGTAVASNINIHV